MKKNYNSISLFAYKRPYHTFRTLKALACNPESIHTNLNVFIDGPKFSSEKNKISSTLKLIEQFKNNFKKLTIYKSDVNKGLSSSIFDGVSHILKEESSTIVLEDDIVTSKNFLKYMNQSIEHFRCEPKVWHISAYNYPIYRKINPETFLWRVMHCWGWATWSDRWESFKKNDLSRDPYYLKDIFSKQMIKSFNLDRNGEDWWSQVESNATNKIDSWAIFWYAHIFLNNGLCLNPKYSLIKNIGLDGSGTFTVPRKDVVVNLDNEVDNFIYPDDLSEDFETVKKLKNYFYKIRFIRFLNKLISKFVLFKNKILQIN